VPAADAMKKTIWSCWFQGRDAAPYVVKRCFASWERKNPGWNFRCVDAVSIRRYVNLQSVVDLQSRSVTAASISDIVRILLLHEFGGVWVDATLLCNRPLDEWLPSAMIEGFFAFAAPAHDRLLSSWFLSAVPDHYLISAWYRSTVDYWSNRPNAQNYFWFHHLFNNLCNSDDTAAEAWLRVPKISADGPHALQFDGLMYKPQTDAINSVDWTTPVFKLTHRLPEQGLPSGSLLEYLLDHEDDIRPSNTTHPIKETMVEAPRGFASLKVSTENLGDHIQIFAGLRLLARLGIEPTQYIDRDDEIHSAPGLDYEFGPVGILLNGWFKTNSAEWPPHPKLVPLILGFHIRLFQCPELISEASIEFFRRHQPIGCRDVYTTNLLQAQGVQAFTSNCLSLTFPRRIDNPPVQTEVFVVSRDERIKNYIPHSIGSYTFINHYTGSRDFSVNLVRAQELLETYRSRAKLIVTTLLHCAFPAIAMGIPVVVFYPLNDEAGHTSDRERFSSLEELVRVYRFDEIENVNWKPAPIDVSDRKLDILDRFHEMAAQWRVRPSPPVGPIAPASVLPPC
jgi:Capsular polysaccharide synthesis protein/Polysaccharide pyruvyl transferase